MMQDTISLETVVNLLERRFDNVDKRFDSHDQRFDKLEDRIQPLELEGINIRNRWATIKTGVRWVVAVGAAGIGWFFSWKGGG